MSGSGVKVNLLKAAGLLGLMTLTSRILGMIRDIVSADAFGTSWQWDAFVFAFMLPNFFRRIVGEGALSSAFIPVYSEKLHGEGAAEAFRVANIVQTFMGFTLAVFVLLAVGAMQFGMHSNWFPLRLQFTFDLLRLLFPYLWFMSLYAFAMGVLNCHKHFFAPSLGPVILDIFWIAGVLTAPWISSLPENQLRWIAWVVLISGWVQCAVQFPPLRKIGFHLQWVWDTGNEALRKMGRLILPSMMAFAIVQINLTVDMTLGFLVGPGANSSLWYGNRLMQFPLGVFAIAVGTALLPMISEQVAKHDLEGSKRTLSFALRTIFFIILPCSVGLIVLRQPIIQLLFERGEFDASSTARTAAVLFGYSIGLFAYSGQKIIATGFYAVQDTRTPVKAGVIALVTNVILNLILMWPLKEAGLALATSLAGILQFMVLLFMFNRKIAQFPFRQIGISFVRILAASILMGLVCCFFHRWTLVEFPGKTLKPLLLQVFISIAGSSAAYVVLCFILRVHEMREAVEWSILRRFRKPADPIS